MSVTGPELQSLLDEIRSFTHGSSMRTEIEIRSSTEVTTSSTSLQTKTKTQVPLRDLNAQPSYVTGKDAYIAPPSYARTTDPGKVQSRTAADLGLDDIIAQISAVTGSKRGEQKMNGGSSSFPADQVDSYQQQQAPPQQTKQSPPKSALKKAAGQQQQKQFSEQMAPQQGYGNIQQMNGQMNDQINGQMNEFSQMNQAPPRVPPRPQHHQESPYENTYTPGQYENGGGGGSARERYQAELARLDAEINRYKFGSDVEEEAPRTENHNHAQQYMNMNGTAEGHKMPPTDNRRPPFNRHHDPRMMGMQQQGQTNMGGNNEGGVFGQAQYQQQQGGNGKQASQENPMAQGMSDMDALRIRHDQWKNAPTPAPVPHQPPQGKNQKQAPNNNSNVPAGQAENAPTRAQLMHEILQQVPDQAVKQALINLVHRGVITCFTDIKIHMPHVVQQLQVFSNTPGANMNGSPPPVPMQRGPGGQLMQMSPPGMQGFMGSPPMPPKETYVRGPEQWLGGKPPSPERAAIEGKRKGSSLSTPNDFSQRTQSQPGSIQRNRSDVGPGISNSIDSQTGMSQSFDGGYGRSGSTGMPKNQMPPPQQQQQQFRRGPSPHGPPQQEYPDQRVYPQQQQMQHHQQHMQHHHQQQQMHHHQQQQQMHMNGHHNMGMQMQNNSMSPPNVPYGVRPASAPGPGYGQHQRGQQSQQQHEEFSSIPVQSLSQHDVEKLLDEGYMAGAML